MTMIQDHASKAKDTRHHYACAPTQSFTAFEATVCRLRRTRMRVSSVTILTPLLFSRIFLVRLCHSPLPLSVGDPPMAPSSCYWITTEHGGPLVTLRQLHLTPPKPLLSPSLQRSGTSQPIQPGKYRSTASLLYIVCRPSLIPPRFCNCYLPSLPHTR